MTNFEWTILAMECYPTMQGEQDVVFQVSWRCAASQGVFPNVLGANSTGSVAVTYEAGTPFTPYDQLTQEQVWGWIDSQIDRKEIEANLQELIDKQANPTVVTPPLPWSN